MKHADNEYLKWKSKTTGSLVRLPTEAEWEYAARTGGKEHTWAGLNNESFLDDYAWYVKNAGSRTHPVGLKKANALGLYDMSGNVWEWVSDTYDEQYYSYSSVKNPVGPPKGPYRVLRGGSWLHDSNSARTSNRGRVAADYSGPGLGFRVVASDD